MYNWSTDPKNLTENSEKHSIWKLEQLLNFGLNGSKISEKELCAYESKLSLDPSRRRVVELFLHGKTSSH